MKPFMELGLSSISNQVLEYAENATGWFEYHLFDTLLIPKHILNGEELFQGLPSFRAGVLKMDPYTCYDWHVDGKRLGTINMLLKGGWSQCLFRKSKGHYFKIEELPYKLDTYYLFNTQVPHTVINYQHERLLFSIEFEEPVPYERLVNWAQSRVYK